jgi:hypothetical protein
VAVLVLGCVLMAVSGTLFVASLIICRKAKVLRKGEKRCKSEKQCAKVNITAGRLETLRKAEKHCGKLCRKVRSTAENTSER